MPFHSPDDAGDGTASPAPIQAGAASSAEGWITWQEGQARTLQLLEDMVGARVPVLGAVAAGGLVTAFDDVQDHLDLAPVLGPWPVCPDGEW